MRIRTEDPISGIIVTNTLEAMGCKRTGPTFRELGHSDRYYQMFPSTNVYFYTQGSVCSGSASRTTTTIFDLMKSIIK